MNFYAKHRRLILWIIIVAGAVLMLQQKGPLTDSCCDHPEHTKGFHAPAIVDRQDTATEHDSNSDSPAKEKDIDREDKNTMSVEEALRKQRSIRDFQDRPLSRELTLKLLWAGQGISHSNGVFRTAPSAGATYPLNTYLIDATGVYQYEPVGNSLKKIREGDHRTALGRACLFQKWVSQAPVSIVFTAVYRRTTARYGDRGEMFVHMEAGHAAQNIHLMAVSMGLGSVPVGAFHQGQIDSILGTSDDEIPLYVISIGHPAR